jgi:hypothetical protein
MAKYFFLQIMIDTRCNTNILTPKTILGKNFEKYCGEWGYDSTKKNVKEFFFWDAQKKLIDDVPTKIKKYQGVSYTYKPMKEKTVLKIMADRSFKNNDNLSLNDITGEKLNKYYDGWDYDLETNIKTYFYYDVPRELVVDVATKIKNNPGLGYEYRPIQM